MKKVLVTGSCGFIFSNFVIYALQKTDWEIVSLDKLTYAGSLLNVSLNQDIQMKRHRFYLCDVCDYHTVSKIFELEKPDIVIHGAGESHVDNSIANSHAFINTNVIGTHSMLEAALKVHTPEKFINVSCYDEDTRAVTKDGLKFYHELKRGDVVFTLNPESMAVEEAKVEKVIIQDYEGDMISMSRPGVDVMVTPNHRVYDENMAICEASDVLNRDYLRFPRPKDFKSNKKDPVFVGNEKKSLEDLFYLAGAYLGDGFTAYQERYVKNKSGLDRKDFLKKCRDSSGRFTSKGKIGNKQSSLSKSWRVFFDIPEGDKARKRTEESLKNLGISFTRQSGKSGEHIYFTSKDWLKFFEQFGKGAQNKNIPKWMLDYDPKYLKCLFDGLIDSDGCRSKGQCLAFTTTSKDLKDGICELATKIGLIPNVNYKFSSSKKFENRVIEGYSWHITFSKSRNKAVRRKDVSQVKYTGKVWCITVKNKNFLVERNGRYIFSGNTDEVYGSVETGFSKEVDPLEPRSPYSSTKASADLLGQSYFTTYGLPVITTRCSNNFGPRQHVEKFIPKVIKNIINKEKIPLYGDGKNIREWIYVQENFRALRQIIEKGSPGEVYNISSGHGISNLEVLEAIFDIMGEGRDLVEHVPDRLGHDKRYALNCDKLRSIGWEPKYTFKGALGHTIGWYKSNTWFCK